MNREDYNLMISAVSFCYIDFYIIITHKVLTDNTITRVTFFAVITKISWLCGNVNLLKCNKRTSNSNPKLRIFYRWCSMFLSSLLQMFSYLKGEITLSHKKISFSMLAVTIFPKMYIFALKRQVCVILMSAPASPKSALAISGKV